MRIATFQYQGRRHVGIVSDDLQSVAPFQWTEARTRRGAQALIEDDVNGHESLALTSAPVPMDQIRLEAPLPLPRRNIFCVGRNYHAHAKELAASVFKDNTPKADSWPIVFTKVPESVIGPHDEVRLPGPHVSTQIDYEAELAVVIGRRAKHVSADRAYDYVLGYTAFNDVTARDFQFADGQWQRGKSCDTFAPMGQTIVTTDTITDPHKLSIKLVLNGQTMQDSNTDQLIFGVPELIEFLSQSITLEPGDVIATGTPPGVGFARNPPVFLKPGDKMEVLIEGMGGLGNPVVSESQLKQENE